MQVRAAYLVFAALATACSTQATKYRLPGAPVFDETDRDSVYVYIEPEDVPGEFIRLADLEASGNFFSSRGQVINKMRSEAAEVGANGLVLGGYDAMGFFEGSWAGFSGGSADEYRRARATAIRSDSVPELPADLTWRCVDYALGKEPKLQKDWLANCLYPGRE
jgi:hypothetical protein